MAERGKVKGVPTATPEAAGPVDAARPAPRYLTCEEQQRRHAILQRFGVHEKGDC